MWDSVGVERQSGTADGQYGHQERELNGRDLKGFDSPLLNMPYFCELGLAGQQLWALPVK